MKQGVANLAQLGEFDEIIDVRSPAEFAEDHIPGALSCPVLDNEERARVGTLYKQVSPFEARKIGAVLVARNIARHVENFFLDRPRGWKPLVYCWRGGQRSGAMAHVLRQIGWHACQLEGGYKTYRRQVVADLAELPRRFGYRVVSGATGSGKSRLLAALAAHGAQVLDLEGLAAHKGSVLGDLPDAPQPSQKMFESRLRLALRRLDPARPVFAEAESRKIGSLHLPDALIESLRASPCVRIEATLAARRRFLLTDYDYFVADPQRLKAKLEYLRELQGNDTLARWHGLIDAGDWETLVAELLERHYDPLYHRSQGKNYARYPDAPRFATDDLSPAGIDRLARDILAAQESLTSA
ncbi:MAG: tRNA 2-selenouridine(34) synthase MnmH [Pseudomonadota bacterium]|jgi:tRNA 2-selenouridine synthase